MRQLRDHTFDGYVCGIPCQIWVDEYVPGTPSNPDTPPDRDPYDPGSVAYRVLDQKGHPAPWLERKIDHREDGRICEQIAEEANHEY